MKKKHFQQASENLFLIATAWHEAAHTICYLNHLKMVERVHILSDNEQYGVTCTVSFDPGASDDKILTKMLVTQEIQSLYAGMVGEKLYYKQICGLDNFPLHLRIGSSSDIEESSKLIKQYNLAPPGQARSVLKKQLQQSTKKILLQYWEDVKLVAHALCKHKDLNFHELKILLTQKSANKTIWREKFKIMSYMYRHEEISCKEIRDSLTKNKK